MIQFRSNLLPLFAIPAKGGTPKDAQDFRYAGVSYHFNDRGDIATCAHIVRSLGPNERLVGVEMYGDCHVFPIDDIRCHPKYDFAVGHVGRRDYRASAISNQPEIFIGTEVMAYGFTTAGLQKGRLAITPRLFKGHIVRTYPEPELIGARSTCEISFPSLNGFSGTPLWLDARCICVVGMLHGNLESTITLHKHTSIDDSGEKFSEEIHRVVELGAAHTAPDIRALLSDLGITRIALADASKAND